ncbi:MAG: DUF721 domain-containing protein [Elusimicrobia bacterium]|nr:DUF721 domain-containing protein [Elusimicrobiota bacterium]
MSKKSLKNFKQLPDAIKDIFFRQGLEERQLIAAYWQKKFSQAIRHARLDKLVNGKLEIKVDSSVWLQQLSLIKEDIKTELNKKIKKDLIKEIVVKIGDIT